MRTTPNLGLKVWDSPSDEFNPADLRDNWDAIDANASAARPASRVQKLSADLSLANLPTLTNTSADIGRLIYLDIAQTGYDTHTIVRWNGTTWSQIGQPSIMGSLPTTANYQGRVVALTAAAGGFAENDLVINTDGANTWKKIGGIASGAALPGSPSAGDLFLLTSAASGFDAYSLVAYNGSAWARTEKRGVEVGAALPGSPYAGQVFVISSAGGGFNAYDVVRYNGSTWHRVGSDEIAYAERTTNLTVTATTEGGADTVVTAPAVTFDGTATVVIGIQTVCQFSDPSHSGTLYLYDGANSLGIIDTPSQTSKYGLISFSRRITPAAGNHTYSLRASMTNAMTIAAGAGTGAGLYQPTFIRITRV